MISAFISAIFNAIGVTFDKLIVSSKYMSGLSMIKLRLFYISILMIIPIVFFGSLQPDFFTPKYILIFVALVINDLVLNLLFYSVLRKKKLSEIEPITLLATPMLHCFMWCANAVPRWWRNGRRWVFATASSTPTT